jgi:hypothetical protein
MSRALLLWLILILIHFGNPATHLALNYWLSLVHLDVTFIFIHLLTLPSSTSFFTLLILHSLPFTHIVLALLQRQPHLQHGVST